MNLYVKGFAIAVGTTLAMSVQASLIGLDLDQEGITETSLAANNNYAGTPGSELSAGQSGFGNATVLALEPGPFKLTFTYLFKEARFTNTFFYQGVELFNTNSAPGSSHSTTYTGDIGALDFMFQSVGLDGSVKTVTNTGNSDEEPRFNTFWNVGSNNVFLALDDHGAGPDGDNDDMIVKITASAIPVPEPGTLALLGLGLAGMGMRASKRLLAA